MTDIIFIIFFSMWTIGWICAWCKKRVDDSDASVRNISEKMLHKNNVISPSTSLPLASVYSKLTL